MSASASQVDAFVDDYLAGYSASDIAARHGVKADSVYYYLAKRGVQLRGNGLSPMRQQRQEARRALLAPRALAAYRRGESIGLIAWNLSVPYRWVQKMLDDAGVGPERSRRPF